MALITGPLSTELGEPSDLSPQGIRTYLKEQHELLAQAFAQGIFIDYLLGARAMVMDRVLSACGMRQVSMINPWVYLLSVVTAVVSSIPSQTSTF